MSPCPSTETDGMPITFQSNEAGEDLVTRSATTPLQHDFVVYGYKTLPTDETQFVIMGYNVKYAESTAGTSNDNSSNYWYVHSGQTIKYWDFGAREYNFWAYTGAKSNFNADGTVLTIPELMLTTTEPTDIEIKNKLFSSLYHRSPVNRDVVTLQFLHPYAKVRVMFFTNDEMTASDEITVSNISFQPVSGPGIVTEGSLRVNYNKMGDARETYTVTAKDAESYLGKFTYGNLTLTEAKGNASNNAALAVPTGGTEYYYVLPVGSLNPTFSLTAEVEGEEKTASVPAGLLQWKPNTAYTYIFKITDAGKKIEFYDVLIDPWKFGGSQDEDPWRNW